MPAQQQVQINAIQALQITDQVLLQLSQWIDEKNKKEINNHPKHSITAKGSILHTRLLLNMRFRQLIQESQKAEQEKREAVIKSLPAKMALEMKAAAVVGEKMPRDVDHLWKEKRLDELIDLSGRH